MRLARREQQQFLGAHLEALSLLDDGAVRERRADGLLALTQLRRRCG